MTQVCLPGCLPCCTAMFRREVELRGLQSAITMLDAPKCYVLILSFTASTVVYLLPYDKRNLTSHSVKYYTYYTIKSLTHKTDTQINIVQNDVL